MQNDTTLQRFFKFRSIVASSNVPNDILMDMIEDYITSDGDDTPIVENIPVLDGQLSLFDTQTPTSTFDSPTSTLNEQTNTKEAMAA